MLIWALFIIFFKKITMNPIKSHYHLKTLFYCEMNSIINLLENKNEKQIGGKLGGRVQYFLAYFPINI